MFNKHNDIFGQAGIDYLNAEDSKKKIKVWCDAAKMDYIPVHYCFRDYSQMPAIEQKALSLCRGKVLDVGACMGAHSLYLQNMGFDVTALEISPLSCEVMKRRGILKVVNENFLTRETDTRYDTIIFLMNGAGMAGKIEQLPNFFEQLRKHLNPGGAVLMDSTDLRYLYTDEDGAMHINLNDKYYGELIYRISYNNFKGEKFPWLFIDEDLLAYHAEKNGFAFTKIMNGTHFDYLAQLTIE